jgi:hypothetical protein
MITKSMIHEVENATVRDRDGASVGKVAQVFPSEDGSAAFVSVATGLFGGNTALVPVEDATFDGSDPRSRKHLVRHRGERRPQALRAVPHRQSDRRHG